LIKQQIIAEFKATHIKKICEVIFGGCFIRNVFSLYNKCLLITVAETGFKWHLLC